MYEMVTFAIEGVIQRLNHFGTGPRTDNGGTWRAGRGYRILLLIGCVKASVLIKLWMEWVLLILITKKDNKFEYNAKFTLFLMIWN